VCQIVAAIGDTAVIVGLIQLTDAGHQFEASSQIFVAFKISDFVNGAQQYYRDADILDRDDRL